MERDCLFSFFHFLVLSDAVGGVEGPGYVMPHGEDGAGNAASCRKVHEGKG